MTGTIFAPDLTLRSRADIINEGVIAADNQATLDAAGRLESGGLVSGRGVSLSAGQFFLRQGGTIQAIDGTLLARIQGDAAIDGRLMANGALDLAALGDLDIRGDVLSAARLDIEADRIRSLASARIQSDGLFAQGRAFDLDGVWSSRSALTVTSSGATQIFGRVEAGGSLFLEGRQLLLSDGSVLYSAEDIRILFDDFRSDGGQVQALRDIGISASGILESSGLLAAGDRLVLNADTIRLLPMSVSVADTVEVSSRRTEIGGTVEARTDATLTATEQMILDGLLQALEAMDIDAAGLNIGAGGALVSGGSLSVRASDLNSAGLLGAQGDFDLLVTNRAAIYGRVQSGGFLAFEAGQVFVGSSGRISSNAAFIFAGSLTNSGSITSATRLDLEILNDFENDGTVVGAGDLVLQANAVRIGSDGALFAHGSLGLTAHTIDAAGLIGAVAAADIVATDFNLSGDLQAQDVFILTESMRVDGPGASLNAGTLLLSADQIVSTGTIFAGSARIEAAGSAEIGGRLDVQSDLDVRSASISLRGVTRAGDLTLDADELDLSGRVHADTSILARATGSISISGDLSFGDTGDFVADTISLTHGASVIGDTALDTRLVLDADDSLMQGGTLAARSIDLRAGNFADTSAALTLATGHLDAIVAGSFLSDGELTAGTLSLSADLVRLSETSLWTIEDDADILVDDTFTISGTLQAGRLFVLADRIELEASSILQSDITADLFAADTARLDGDLRSAGLLSVSAHQIQTGTLSDVSSNSGVVLTAGDAGILIAGHTASLGDVHLGSARDIFVSGSIASAGLLDISAAGDIRLTGDASGENVSVCGAIL